jgi:hypothetical protein
MIEENANPYNMKKDWHQGKDKPFVDADSIFFDESQAQATSSETEAPAEKTDSKEVNYKKRYDDLKKHYDQKVSQFKQREEELIAEAKASAPSYKAPKSVEEIEQFKQKYPDLYQTVETVAHLQNEQQLQDIRSELVTLKQREADIARKEAEAQLKARHPDFEDIRADDNFHEWAKAQPEEIQSWIYQNSNNANLASRAIDLYKMENGIAIQSTKTPSKQKANTAADMVSTKTKTIDARQPKIWTEREIARMSVAEFDKYEDDINQAISEGRVIK